MRDDDPRDRMGQKLREKEKAEEDKFFAEREKAAIAKLREQVDKTLGPAPHGRCPRCATALITVNEHGVAVDECPKGHGMWLDRGELETIAKREHESWLSRYFYRPRLEG